MDQSLFAAPHGLSQRTTSFIASQRQGIHQIPLSHLIALIIHAQTARGSPIPRGPGPSRPSRAGQDLRFQTRPGRGAVKAPRHAAAPRTTPSRGSPGTGRVHSSRCRTTRPATRAGDAPSQPNSLSSEPTDRRILRMRTRGARPPRSDRPAPQAMGRGGARRDRTDDLMLAKHALSQLSYGPMGDRSKPATRDWWAWEDSNFRPHAYQARALTD